MPSGIPRKVGPSNHPVARKWTFRQSWTTTMAATVIDRRTATGAAISIGMISASNGTAIRPSPNPNVERIKLAINTTNKTWRVIVSIVSQHGFSGDECLRLNVAQRGNSTEQVTLSRGETAAQLLI